ncbi:MAG: hypothetical protein NVSMB10_00030 [Steroidobacteraceae bacterium]
MPGTPGVEGGEKFDHSDHPTAQPLPDDLHAPGGGSIDISDESRGGVSQKKPVTPAADRRRV